MTTPQEPNAFDAGYHQNYAAPQGGYAQPPLAQGRFDAIRSLEQAWRIFAEKPAGWLISALIYLGLFFALFVVSYFGFIGVMVLNSDPETGDYTGGVPWGLIITVSVAFLLGLVSVILWQLVTTREAVYAVGGKRPEVKDFFTFRRCGMLFLMTIVLMLLSTLGLVVFIIGAFVVSFFMMFAMPAIVFDDMSIGAAVKSSYTVAKENLGQALLLWIMTSIINGVGSSTYIAVIFTGPLCIIAVSHAYLLATGRPVQERLR